MVKILELFSGSRSVGKCCDKLGWDSVSVDMILPANHKCDIMDCNYKLYDKDEFDIIWASPPCVHYSRIQDSNINRVIKGELYTKEVQEKNMKDADKLVLKSLEIINYFNPTYWFIENPLGRLMNRPFMKDLPMYKVDYCMYSDWGYKKRTCIWTNKKDFKPLTCNKNCGNMIGKYHKTNLGNIKGCNYRPTQYEKYRVPEELIFSLFLE